MVLGAGRVLYDATMATPGTVQGDRVLTYYDKAVDTGKIWETKIVIRGDLVVYREVNPYSTPWYVPYLPSER
jgi:hypothetical protein